MPCLIPIIVVVVALDQKSRPTQHRKLSASRTQCRCCCRCCQLKMLSETPVPFVSIAVPSFVRPHPCGVPSVSFSLFLTHKHAQSLAFSCCSSLGAEPCGCGLRVPDRCQIVTVGTANQENMVRCSMNANKPPTEKTGGLRSGRSITRSDWEKPNNLSQTSAQHEYVCCRDKRLIMVMTMSVVSGAATTTTRRVALSLSGAGHLLTYHLGVCQTLLTADDAKLTVGAIAGSSGGAVAAAVAALMPPSGLEDFNRDFVHTSGNASGLLEDGLRSSRLSPSTDLHICTTTCRNGSVRMFTFPAHETVNLDRLLTCIQASCWIPLSFHLADTMAGSDPALYHQSDGILIDNDFFVDGGIAAPAPPTPDDMDRIVVSPIAGGKAGDDDSIRPVDKTEWFRLGQMRLRGDFSVGCSWQNLKAMRVATGAAQSSDLQVWYEQGLKDAESYLSKRTG